jgi:hypothetical protein
MKSYVLLILSVAFLFSCKKDNSAAPAGSSSLIKFITSGGEDTAFYFYDNQGRCVKYNNEQEPYRSAEYKYSGNVITAVESGGTETIYYMKSGKFPDSVISPGNSVIGKFIERFVYDAAGTLLNSTFFNYDTDTPFYRVEYTFVNGDPVKLVSTPLPEGSGPVWTAVQYFDTSKINSIPSPQLGGYIMEGKHLLIRRETEYHDGSFPPSVADFTYTFDALGRVHTRDVIEAAGTGTAIFGYY